MGSSEKEEILASSGEGVVTDVETNKCCSDCKTTKTPLWRSGPSGPKSLCNACGIRYRKNGSSPVLATACVASRMCKNDPKKGKIGKRRNVKLRNGLRVNLMGLQQRSERQWGEVERAALLLMALSCGAVFA